MCFAVKIFNIEFHTDPYLTPNSTQIHRKSTSTVAVLSWKGAQRNSGSLMYILLSANTSINRNPHPAPLTPVSPTQNVILAGREYKPDLQLRRTKQQTGVINSWQGCYIWKCVLNLNGRRSSLLEHFCYGITYTFYNVQCSSHHIMVISRVAVIFSCRTFTNIFFQRITGTICVSRSIKQYCLFCQLEEPVK